MKIAVIPDTQCAAGSPLRHLLHASRLIIDERPDAIVHLGDHWDMASLSRYDPLGSKTAEGQRYAHDIDAGNAGMRALCSELVKYNEKRREFKERQWWPDRYFIIGNHEERIERAIENNPRAFEGVISYDDFELGGWQVVPFLEVLELEGVCFSHYFQNRNTGRPWGGEIPNRLAKIGHSFVMGHQQGFRWGEMHTVLGHRRQGIAAGSFYPEGMKYQGPQGSEWRGMFIMDDVFNGEFEIRRFSIDKLRDMYGREA
jgi:hypothetical protein